MCLFVELFSCLWPAARDSQGRNGCFPPMRLMCCSLWLVCCVALCFGKIRAGGQEGQRKRCGWRGWRGCCRGVGVATAPRRDTGMGRVPVIDWSPVSGCLTWLRVSLPDPPPNCAPWGLGLRKQLFFWSRAVVFGLWTSKEGRTLPTQSLLQTNPTQILGFPLLLQGGEEEGEKWSRGVGTWILSCSGVSEQWSAALACSEDQGQQSSLNLQQEG